MEAFRSTLEEVADSDLILHVVDVSHPDPEGQIAAVRSVFSEVDARKVPEIIVLNKADAADPFVVERLKQREPRHVVVSARTGQGIAELLKAISEAIPRPEREAGAADAVRPRRPASASCTRPTPRSSAWTTRKPARAPSVMVREGLAAELEPFISND